MAKIARGTVPGYITQGGAGYSFLGTWKNPTTGVPESIAGYTFVASLNWSKVICGGNGDITKPSTIVIVNETGGIFSINGTASDVQDLELGPNVNARIILTVTDPNQAQFIFVIPIIGEIP